MDVEFVDADLDQAETDASYTAGLQPGLLKAFRKVMQLVRSAKDERDFWNMRSLRFEEMKGKRRGEYSMRLNDQFRLVVTLEGKGPTKKVRIKGIEDYH